MRASDSMVYAFKWYLSVRFFMASLSSYLTWDYLIRNCF